MDRHGLAEAALDAGLAQALVVFGGARQRQGGRPERGQAGKEADQVGIAVAQRGRAGQNERQHAGRGREAGQGPPASRIALEKGIGPALGHLCRVAEDVRARFGR